MKRIVICCDGTWKRLDAHRPTNVVKLARAVLPRGRDGVAQVVLHLDGVGTGRGTGGVARAIDRGLGGVFGLGLMATMETAYRFLIFNYAPGDEIYLFGFSRGAYTARSLVGLMRNSGILRREHVSEIGRALALYQARDASSHPDGGRAKAFRSRFAVRGAQDVLPRVRYLGVWDTVGALGVPAYLELAPLFNRRLGFHDTRLSGLVRSARHAVAIDERRRAFPPALWDNLDERNQSAPGAQRYRQCWFPGDHSSVGGGGEVTGLSNEACLWIAEGASNAGLKLDAELLAELVRGSDCFAPLRASPGARGPAALLLGWSVADRQGPRGAEEIAAAAMRRWRCDARYRPAALERLAAAIESAGRLRRAG